MLYVSFLREEWTKKYKTCHSNQCFTLVSWENNYKRNKRQVVRWCKGIYNICILSENIKLIWMIGKKKNNANTCHIKESKTNTKIYCKEQKQAPFPSFSRVFCFCFSIVSCTVVVSYSSFYMKRVLVRIW